MSLHVGPGRSVAKALKDVTDYMENPLKTEGGELISSFECAPRTAGAEFLLSKKQYGTLTGRDQGRRDIFAYHTRHGYTYGATNFLCLLLQPAMTLTRLNLRPGCGAFTRSPRGARP